MSRRQLVSLGAATALALGVPLALPSSAQLVRAETLGAVTTMTVDHSGTAELVLYDDATLSPLATRNPDVAFSGPGRLVGFSLTRSDGMGDTLAAVRMPGFAGGATSVGGSTTPGPRCTPFPDQTVPVSETCTDNPKAIVLHEGYYHLVVLADGGPLRLTIRLHGLGIPHATLHLQATMRSVELPLKQHESIGSSTITYGGATSALAGQTQVAMVVAAKLHDSATLLAATTCYRNDNGAPPPYAYAPGCPNGATQSYAYRVNAPAASPVGEGVLVFSAPGSADSASGQGGSFTDSDGPTYVGGLGLWLAGGSLPFFGTFSSP
jgi:hypothetical protein